MGDQSGKVGAESEEGEGFGPTFGLGHLGEGKGQESIGPSTRLTTGARERTLSWSKALELAFHANLKLLLLTGARSLNRAKSHCAPTLGKRRHRSHPTGRLRQPEG